MFVIGTLQVGGSEMHLLQVARALIRRGWRVSLCSLSGDGALRADFEAAGVDVYLSPVERSSTMGLLTRVAKLSVVAAWLFMLFLRRRPSIVHFFLPRAYLTGAPLALAAALPVRVMSRRSLNVYQDAHPLLARAERILHRTMHAVLGNSRSVMRELHAEGVSESRSALIYNGIDVKRFDNLPPKDAVRARLGLQPDALVFCIVANLIPYKGHGDLLEALAIAGRELPDWHLLIVGRDDGIGEQLARRAAELKIAGRITFLGSRADVQELLTASDIALSCSHEEGFSNAVIEAMACGLPMVVTDVGGNPEAVIAGGTGYVVPPRDPSAFAAAIVRLASDPVRRAAFGRAGRQRTLRDFSLDHCVDQYDHLYRALLETRGTAIAQVQGGAV